MKQSKRKSNKNWRYYLLELLVVFVGVTGAFLLNTWRENRLAKSQYGNYLESIRADLREDQENLKENIDFLKENNRMLGKFLYHKGDDWTKDSTNVVMTNSIHIVAFIGKSSTYESMKYSGHLNLVRDFDTRTAIISYYESFSSITFIDEITQQWVTEHMVEIFLEKMDMRKSVFIDNAILDELSFLNKYSGLLVLLNQSYNAYLELFKKNKMLIELLDK